MSFDIYSILKQFCTEGYFLYYRLKYFDLIIMNLHDSFFQVKNNRLWIDNDLLMPDTAFFPDINTIYSWLGERVVEELIIPS